MKIKSEFVESEFQKEELKAAIIKFKKELRTFICISCEKKIKGIPYSESATDFNHGSKYCEQCWAKTHPKCICNNYLEKQWHFCPNCGFKNEKMELKNRR